MLDTLRPTSAGLDGLPAWYLKVAAPLFCNQLAYLFNLSFATASVPQPHQWKEACITPVPKVSAPQLPADYRPISITPILTRIMERAVVRSYLYLAFQKPPPGLEFSDQFAFRPTASTTAAIISLLQTVTTLLQSNPFVVVISLDFSKAFGTVRHSSLLAKMAKLDLPAVVYNWLVAFFTGHAHRTVVEVSSTRSITASIIQGSSIGPASYTVTAADLQPLNASNQFFKFADDTYLVVPAESVDTRAAELSNIITWAATNNWKLNKLKTKEVVFYDSRRRRKLSPPPLLPDVDRDTTLKVLGVTLSSNMSASEHIRRVVSDSAQTLYAVRVLRHHGIKDAGLR